MQRSFVGESLASRATPLPQDDRRVGKCLGWPFGVGLASWFPAGPESCFLFTQGLRPGLNLCRPFGAGFGGAVAVRFA